MASLRISEAFLTRLARLERVERECAAPQVHLIVAADLKPGMTCQVRAIRGSGESHENIVRHFVVPHHATLNEWLIEIEKFVTGSWLCSVVPADPEYSKE